MALVTCALTQTVHPGRRSHVGRPSNGNTTWRLSSAQDSKRRCNLSFVSRAARITSAIADEKSFVPPTRDWFAPNFIFGAATSAYQIEGAWNEGGKGPSNWDHFCHTHPDKITDGANADVSTNSYHLYEEDVRMLKEMGMDAYRFSISWSRILPKGTIEGGINYEGIKYYKNLIKLLKDNGIEPFVTIFHWDIPQVLEDSYRGFLDRRIVKDYTNYAKLCFDHFGDKVKNWLTFNEPRTYCNFAYKTGDHAPGRCSPGQNCAIQYGDSSSEPYRVGHHILLAHAEASDLYRKYYQGADGRIGMAMDVVGYEPYDKTSYLDKQAQQRAFDFGIGWFMEPLYRGEYPFTMRSLLGHRLPFFTDEEKAKLKGSASMMGLNYYSSIFAKHHDIPPVYTPSATKEDSILTLEEKDVNGNLIGPDLQSGWVRLYPQGLKELLQIMKDKYGNPPMFITENGAADYDGSGGHLSKEDALNDTKRLDYIQRHIAVCKESIDTGVNLQGYFAWSLLDNFEWAVGYSLRFGVVYVDFNDEQKKREMKKSAKWFSEFNNPTPPSKVSSNNVEVLKPAPPALLRI